MLRFTWHCYLNLFVALVCIYKPHLFLFFVFFYFSLKMGSIRINDLRVLCIFVLLFVVFPLLSVFMREKVRNANMSDLSDYGIF